MNVLMQDPTTMLLTDRLARRFNVLATLATTPVLSAKNLAVLHRVSTTTMRRDLSWLDEHKLVQSCQSHLTGTSNERYFFANSNGLAWLLNLQQCRSVPATTGQAQPRIRDWNAVWRQYHHRFLVVMQRLPHYVQVQDFGDLLARTWRNYVSPCLLTTDSSTEKETSNRDGIGEEQRITATDDAWQWLRDATLGYYYRGRHTTCHVDALVVGNYTSTAVKTSSQVNNCYGSQNYMVEHADRGPITRQQSTALLFIYLDDGLSSVHAISRRLKKLLCYRYEQGIPSEKFPVVVVKASTRHRAWQWASASQMSSHRLALEPLLGILLFPPDSDQSNFDTLDPPSDSQLINDKEPVWPLIQGGLAIGPTPRFLNAYDFMWRPLVNGPAYRNSLARLAPSLFCQCDSDVVRIMLDSLERSNQSVENFITANRTLTRKLGTRLKDLSLTTPGSKWSAAHPTWQSKDRQEILKDVQAMASGRLTLNRSQKQWLYANIIVGLERQHLLLLALIANHPLISVVDLAKLAYLKLESVRRSLSQLRQLQLLEFVMIAAPSTGLPVTGRPSALCEHNESQQLISNAALRCARVTPVGSDFVSAVYGQPPHNLGLETRLSERLTCHDTGVRRFLGLMVEQVREPLFAFHHSAGQKDLCHIEINLTRWQNDPAVSLRFVTDGEPKTIVPDAVGEIRVSVTQPIIQNHQQNVPSKLSIMSHVQRLWLEWDAGTENARDLRDKFAAYQKYVQHQTWTAPERTLPALLIVTPDERQEQRILRIIAELCNCRPENQSVYASSVDVIDKPNGTQQNQGNNYVRWWHPGGGWLASQLRNRIQQPAKSTELPGPVDHQIQQRRLLVYLTTTQRIAPWGPLGPCWIVRALC